MFFHLGALLIGALIGFLSGLFGVGGSSISTPLLRMVLEVPRLIALATPLPVTLPTALAGGLTYYRKGLLDLKVALWVSLCGVPSVIVGSLLTKVISDRFLMGLTALVVILIGVRVMRRERALAGKGPSLPAAAIPDERRRACIVGGAVGLASGMLANGGGFLLVPAFILIFGMEMQRAAGTSLLCVAAFAIPGTLIHWYLGHIDPKLTFLLTLGVIPSTSLGARLAIRIDARRLQKYFGGFLLVFGIIFLIRVIFHAIEAWIGIPT